MKHDFHNALLSRFTSSKVLKFKVLSLITLLTFELLNAWNLEPLFAQANYYQGKTIRVIVGYQAGDSHDQWARTYTRYSASIFPVIRTFSCRTCPVPAA